MEALTSLTFTPTGLSQDSTTGDLSVRYTTRGSELIQLDVVWREQHFYPSPQLLSCLTQPLDKISQAINQLSPEEREVAEQQYQEYNLTLLSGSIGGLMAYLALFVLLPSEVTVAEETWLTSSISETNQLVIRAMLLGAEVELQQFLIFVQRYLHLWSDLFCHECPAEAILSSKQELLSLAEQLVNDSLEQSEQSVSPSVIEPSLPPIIEPPVVPPAKNRARYQVFTY